MCSPALIYLIFSLVQIIIDTTKGYYNTALMKVWVTAVFTILLNALCERGLDIISWIIVFIPFILMTVIISVLLLVFGLDPSSGKIINQNMTPPVKSNYVDARAASARNVPATTNVIATPKKTPVVQSPVKPSNNTQPLIIKEKIIV